MAAAGCELLRDMTDLAVMGLFPRAGEAAEVLSSLRDRSGGVLSTSSGPTRSC